MIERLEDVSFAWYRSVPCSIVDTNADAPESIGVQCMLDTGNAVVDFGAFAKLDFEVTQGNV